MNGWAEKLEAKDAVSFSLYLSLYRTQTSHGIILRIIFYSMLFSLQVFISTRGDILTIDNESNDKNMILVWRLLKGLKLTQGL